MSAINIKNLSKKYMNGTVALSDINLDIADGDTIVLFGGTGAGKTTLLKIIAGLVEEYEGEINLDGKCAKELTVENRNVAFATFDFMKRRQAVYDVLAFPLRLRKLDGAYINERVRSIADLLEIKDILYEKVAVLSRYIIAKVAIARALVRDAEIYIFDSLLEDLPQEHRYELLLVIMKLRERIKGTFIFATEDYFTTLFIPGRIIVMNYGYIDKIGLAKEIYENGNAVAAKTILKKIGENIYE